MEDDTPLRFESLAERRIREAIDAGEFDHLPGEGEPLPGAGQPDDELWWVRAWMERAHMEANDVRHRGRGSGRDSALS